MVKAKEKECGRDNTDSYCVLSKGFYGDDEDEKIVCSVDNVMSGSMRHVQVFWGNSNLNLCVNTKNLEKLHGLKTGVRILIMTETIFFLNPCLKDYVAVIFMANHIGYFLYCI